MNNSANQLPYSSFSGVTTPIPYNLLPLRGALYICDTPDWPIINGFRSEICANLQVDAEAVMLSLAVTIATVVQTMADVERSNGLTGPVSLFANTVGGGSDRKSSIDKIVTHPLRLCETNQRIKVSEIDRKNDLKKMVINAKKSGYLKAIQNGALSSHSGDDSYTELAALLEQEVVAQLEKLIESQPKDKKPLTFIMENLTLEALFEHLKDDRTSKGIISAEGLNAYTARLMQGQSYLNSIFSGDPVTIHRKSGACYTINDARVSMGIAVQPEPFLALVNDKRRGKNMRDSGFASRFLYYRMSQRGGTRFDNTGKQTWHFREQYNARMGELLAEALQSYRNPDQPRKVLKFTPDARKYWLDIYNAIEAEMGFNGRYVRCHDHAGKLAEIIARVAAVFHYFEGIKGDISITSLDYAMRLCMRCSDFFLDIFDLPTEEIADAITLNEWFNTHLRSINQRFIQRNTLRQYCPNKLRGKHRLNNALVTLAENGLIDLFMWGKTHYVDLYPNQSRNDNTLTYMLGMRKH